MKFLLLFLVSMLLTNSVYADAVIEFSSEEKKRLAVIIQNNHYLSPKVNSEDLSDSTSLNKLLKDIDPYSKFFSAEEIRFKNARNGKQRLGIGLDLLIDDEKILGVPIKGGPAYQAGFTSSKYIDFINEKKIDPSNFDSYSFLVKLSNNEDVLIETLLNDSTKNYKYKAKVTRFEQKHVFLDSFKDYDVLTIREFSDDSTNKVKKLLNTLSPKKALVFDLRHNPGGDLYSTVDMLSFFLESDLTVAYLNENKISIPLQTLSDNGFQQKKLFILLSPFTASSAEVFAQAIKHFIPETKLVGLPTFGKCLAQKMIMMKNGSAIQLSAYKLLNAKKDFCQNKPLDIDLKIKNIETKSLKTIIKNLLSQL